MARDHSATVVSQDLLDDLTRMDRSAINRAAEKFRETQPAVSRVKMDQREHLVLQVRQGHLQVVLDCRRRGQRAAALKSLRQCPACRAEQLVGGCRSKVAGFANVQRM